MTAYYPVYQPLNLGGSLYGVPNYPYWIVLADPELISRYQAAGTIGDAYPKPLPDLPPKPRRLLNVNSATEDELLSINGIGKTLASAIVQNRPYQSLEDLRSLSNRVNWDVVLSFLTLGERS